MKNNYEKLRKECFKIIYPDGIPLEFGCEVVWESKDPKVALRGLYLAYEDDQQGWVRVYSDSIYASQTKGVLVPDEKDLLILGRPLSLQDLLRAIKKKIRKLLIDEDTLLIFIKQDMRHYSPSVHIDLTLPISEQNESVLEELIEIIK